MEKYAVIKEALGDRVYSRLDLFNLIYQHYPAYSPNSCNWIIGQLCDDGAIAPIGNGLFIRGKKQWSCLLSKPHQSLLQKLQTEFQNSNIACIHSSTLNVLSKMEGGENCLILEIEKRDVFPCYMKLRELTKKDVLLTPTEHELAYYLKPDSIILKPIFSKSPCNKDGSFTLEKLVVDIVSDRLIKCLYPSVDFADAIINEIVNHNLNIITVLNYAKRRRCYESVRDMVVAAVPSDVWAAVKGEDYD